MVSYDALGSKCMETKVKCHGNPIQELLSPWRLVLRRTHNWLYFGSNDTFHHVICKKNETDFDVPYFLSLMVLKSFIPPFFLLLSTLWTVWIQPLHYVFGICSCTTFQMEPGSRWQCLFLLTHFTRCMLLQTANTV